MGGLGLGGCLGLGRGVIRRREMGVAGIVHIVFELGYA